MGCSGAFVMKAPAAVILTLTQTHAADGTAAHKLSHSKLSGLHPASLQFSLDIFSASRRLLLAPELCYPVFQGNKSSVITVILYKFVANSTRNLLVCSNKTGSEKLFTRTQLMIDWPNIPCWESRLLCCSKTV